ncbi:MAG: DUF1343 domain-containing protein [Ignavibacteria bacterium]|nr:DUF1343 domain-containing protein [Ignavibacteria bacterium]
MKTKITAIIFFFLLTAFNSMNEMHLRTENNFRLGNEVLISRFQSMLVNKKIGLITNKSGVTQDGKLFLDALSKEFNVTKIFSPEHGLRGDDNESDFTDPVTGIPVVSLYGSKKKPDSADLENTDVLVYDIQDVGARFYTFINTMFYCIESAVENNKEVIVCDRPLIPYGRYTDGFMLDEEVSSFVGLINIPIAYGMTCGELANFINGEYFQSKCKLNIAMMENYSHGTDYGSLNLPWIKPSPNIYYPSSAVSYLGTCLFEGTNFSEGRGTERPFEYVGAPYCDGDILANEMNNLNLKGVSFESITFTPTVITSPSNPPKYVGELCKGVFINVTDKNLFEPVKTGIALLVTLNKLFPGFEIKKNNFIDKLAGTTALRTMIVSGNSYEEITDSYKDNLKIFSFKRENYILYK